jgi:type II secretory pathway pseudopilin PulG
MYLSKILMSGIAAAVLASPAFAEDRSTEKQKEQYLYQQSQEQGLGAEQGAIGQTKPNSGPGVQGAPDTRTGPATHEPGGASSGASSGEAGMGNPGVLNKGDGTQPSQDSSGVQGFPDTRTGPSTRAPEDGSQGAGSSAQ